MTGAQRELESEREAAIPARVVPSREERPQIHSPSAGASHWLNPARGKATQELL